MIQSEGEEAKQKGVVIGYDVRHMSYEFAHLAAEIFAGHGIRVHFFPTIEPTPVVSYTIRHLHAFAGVMVTASHNPREYNGYKAYGTEGSQILDDWADAIEHLTQEAVADGEIGWMDFDAGLAEGWISMISDQVLEDYYQDVLSLTIHEDIDPSISIVYSALNGCGNIPIQTILKRRGFHQVHIVAEEEQPDPDFTTTGYPNPERPEVFRLAERDGAKVQAELLLASDPDSDRLAIEVRRPDGSYQFLNGNHIGALLVHYILSELKAKGELPSNGAVIKSIVTGDIARKICKKYGVTLLEVLTGFKNIAAPMNEWDTTHEHEFLFGYEESIGYNRGSFVRDKDAVSSAMLLAEAAGYYKKSQNKTLLEVLHDIYEEYGYHDNALVSVVKEGSKGQAQIQNIMESLRTEGLGDIGGHQVIQRIDYLKDETGLSRSNVLKFIFDDESWCAVRPSGTEPKIKLYVYAVGNTEEEAAQKVQEYSEKIAHRMNAI